VCLEHAQTHLRLHHPRDRWPDAVDVDRIARYARAFTDIGLQLANGVS